MPNSGTVTAGSVALASQYNNLRSDVLDASTGHTHTGAADAGAQIEGTVIKSTGATPGHILTAGTGGTATTWAAAPAGGGNYNALSTATAVFIQPSSTTISTATFGTRDLKPINAGANGSVIAVKDQNNNVPLNPTYNVRWFSYNNATPIGTTTITPAQSGSTIADAISGYGFDSASTAIVWKENSGTGTVVYATVRKQNISGTILWSNTLVSAGSSVNGVGGEAFGPFRTANGLGPVYAKEVATWLGGDYRYSNVYWSGTASFYSINDASGSVYSAGFGTASGTSTASSYVYTESFVFIPAASGSAGTVHHWFTDSSGGRTSVSHNYWFNTYSVTGTSITEVAAPSQTTTFAGITSAQYVPTWAYWDQTTGVGLANYGGTLITFDRTGARISERGASGTSSSDRDYGYAHEQSWRQTFDARSGWLIGRAGSSSLLFKMGTALAANFAPTGDSIAADQNLGANEGAVLAGASGTATHVWVCGGAGTGQVYFRELPGYAEVTVLGTAASGIQARIVGLVSATGGSASYSVSADGFPFGAVANNQKIAMGTATYVQGFVATTFSTAAATASVTSYSIDLS